MEEKRNKTIDILKGIGIIFVIIGHIALDYGQENLFTYIYSFHMPLFFFISGYLSYGRKKNKLGEYIKRSFIKYMVPYYIFLLISIFFTETFIAFMQTGELLCYSINWKNLLLAFLLGGGYLNKIPCLNFALWYLPLYFVAKICFETILHYEKTRRLLLCIIFILIFITIPFQNLLPGRPFLHINVLPAALVFMGIGYLFKKYEEKDKYSKSFTGIALIAGIIIAYINGGNISEIKSLIYFLGAFCSIYFWYHIAKQSSNTIWAYIGKNAFIIYPLHMLISSTFPYTGIEIILLQKWDYDSMFLIIRLIYIVLLSIIISVLYNKSKNIEITLFPKEKNKRKERA